MLRFMPRRELLLFITQKASRPVNSEFTNTVKRTKIKKAKRQYHKNAQNDNVKRPKTIS